MLSSVINLFFPKVCFACDGYLHDNENDFCISCRHALPVTNFHFNKDHHVRDVFYGRSRIEHATALLYFQKKGRVQHLLHNLKYKKQERIGTILGQWLGGELNSIPEYHYIDVVIPVPLHASKLKKRGYNQVDKFAQEIALALNSDFINDALVKVTKSSSQVFKNRFKRWQSKQQQFALQNADTISNKHILLVDDIITTGATLEACIIELQKSKGIKISIAAIAFTS